MMTSEKYLDELEQFILQLAAEAGTVLREAFLAATIKPAKLRTSPKQMHLAEDRTMDQWLIDRIQQRYPEHAILTEESGVVGRVDNGITSQVRWIIDPIDGSVNFSTHNPFVAISLAVMVDERLEMAVVEAPLLGERFSARRGRGAFCQKQSSLPQRLAVSTTATLAEAYLVSCDGGLEDRAIAFEKLVQNYYDQVKDFRKLGSAALECAWVASGRADAYVTMAIDPWDVAAGVLLIEEAGGRVTNFNGAPWKPEQTDIVCSNGLLHEQLVARL